MVSNATDNMVVDWSTTSREEDMVSNARFSAGSRSDMDWTTTSEEEEMDVDVSPVSQDAYSERMLKENVNDLTRRGHG